MDVEEKEMNQKKEPYIVFPEYDYLREGDYIVTIEHWFFNYLVQIAKTIRFIHIMNPYFIIQLPVKCKTVSLAVFHLFEYI